MSQRRARRERNVAQASTTGAGARRFPGGAFWWALGAAAVVAILAIGIFSARGTGAADPILDRDGDSVVFSGEDPITGKTVSLADYAGEPLVINVWGSWCTGCIAEAEDLRRFAEDHPEVQLVGVDLQDSRSGAREFYEKWRWTHPSVFDPSGEISFSLGLQGTPTTFFTDPEHRIVTRIVGETDYAGFERGLETALGES